MKKFIKTTLLLFTVTIFGACSTTNLTRTESEMNVQDEEIAPRTPVKRLFINSEY